MEYIIVNKSCDASTYAKVGLNFRELRAFVKVMVKLNQARDDSCCPSIYVSPYDKAEDYDRRRVDMAEGKPDPWA
jgi:hypothetical protein